MYAPSSGHNDKQLNSGTYIPVDIPKFTLRRIVPIVSKGLNIICLVSSVIREDSTDLYAVINLKRSDSFGCWKYFRSYLYRCQSLMKSIVN